MTAKPHAPEAGYSCWHEREREIIEAELSDVCRECRTTWRALAVSVALNLLLAAALVGVLIGGAT